MKPVHRVLFAAAIGVCLLSTPAFGSVLTFEVFDPGLDFPPFNTLTPPPHLDGYGYPEGFPFDSTYGQRIDALEETIAGGTIFRYGVGAEGFTPNVSVSYGPFSIFTGSPELWRGGFGDLFGVLRQGSLNTGVGFNYDILDIVLYADPGFDVVLYGFELAAADFELSFYGIPPDPTISSVTIYDGVPFPFLTPTNQIFEEDDVVVSSTGHATFDDFGAGSLQSHVIWLRIDASNLGDGSRGIGIDNIRFGQVENALSTETLDPATIDAAFQSAEAAVPEPASLAIFLVGGALAFGVARRRKRQDRCEAA